MLSVCYNKNIIILTKRGVFLSRFPYLLFDADDTLLDFERNGARAFTMLCAKYQFPCTDESREIYESFNQPLWRDLERGIITKEYLKVERFRRFLDYLNRSEDPAVVNQDFLHFLGSSSFLMPHAEEVCRALSENHELYILTNSVESVHVNRMEQSMLRPYVKASFISESIGYEKPNKYYFEEVFHQIPGITKENCLLIGDSLSSDMQGGINFGIPVCWYNFRKIDFPSTLPIDYIIHDLRELLPLVG